jgi:hypothetical protein
MKARIGRATKRVSILKMGKSAEYPFPQGEYSELEAVRKGQNSEFYKELTRIPKLLGVYSR